MDSIDLISKANWIVALVQKLGKIKKTRATELDKINDEILFDDPIALAQSYVEPYCQEINPADRFDEDFFAAREPVFKKVNEFLKTKPKQQGGKHLFILSDAGMGKTSFLVMLKLLHVTSFWPKSYNCVLLKLGESTLAEIEALSEKRNTVLLLDSLDEDPCAYENTIDRLSNILDKTTPFRRVIITCRTQFFPSSKGQVIETPGRMRVGGFSCPTKYLSIFDDDQVSAYIAKAFPLRFIANSVAKKKRARANLIVRRMSSLRCRPMLLSFIEELESSPNDFTGGSEFNIYESLVGCWLLREQGKTGVSSDELLRASSELAYKMQSEKKAKVTEAQLDQLIGNLHWIGSIKKIDMTGRSLINRNSDGDYRFSHYSIQEFLVVFYIFNFTSINDKKTIYATDFIIRLIKENKEQLKVKIEKEVLSEVLEIESKMNPFYAHEQQDFHVKSEISKIIVDAIPELEELDMSPYSTNLDIPTFIRNQIDKSKKSLSIDDINE